MAEKMEEGYGGIRFMEANIPADRVMIFSAGKVYLFNTLGALLAEAAVKDLQLNDRLHPPKGDEG